MAARHEEITDKLRRAIGREDYAVGSPLPAEADLTACCGVSRGTVDQAVAALTVEGLIGSRQGVRPRGSDEPPQPGLRRAVQLRAVGARWGARRPGTWCPPPTAPRRWRTPNDWSSPRVPPVLHILRVRGLGGEPVCCEVRYHPAWPVFLSVAGCR
ncbi:GntR family transcriptional regulator [Streptomyces sp. NPDC056411]|uniref:GntR family transcriptional regulator n=1 Tax=Streptomyces sp. NPDC056411 TaxID=3345813 RepID=UPI0035DC9C47